mmetsp:Transcript_76370/g.181627  ORF Transcript_76370/g.181627 Transcript_76370/m.181627 type:complete len:149 (-) Transcript_76370:92-538(-)
MEAGREWFMSHPANGRMRKHLALPGVCLKDEALLRNLRQDHLGPHTMARLQWMAWPGSGKISDVRMYPATKLMTATYLFTLMLVGEEVVGGHLLTSSTSSSVPCQALPYLVVPSSGDSRPAINAVLGATIILSTIAKLYTYTYLPYAY